MDKREVNQLLCDVNVRISSNANAVLTGSRQVLSVMYGFFAGLRGFLISLLNTDLIQNLR